MPTASPAAPATMSPGSASNSPGKKYSTIAGVSQFSSRSGGGSTTSAGTVRQRQSVRGLFDLQGPSSSSTDAKESATRGSSAQAGATQVAAGVRAADEDGPWSVSVAEAAGERRHGRKKAKAPPSFTIYVTTPTHNLTLTRTAAEIVELDAKLREGVIARADRAVPSQGASPSAKNSSTSAVQAASTTTTTAGAGGSDANGDAAAGAVASLPPLPPLPQAAPSQGGRLLQTLSRTLSPGGSRTRVALNNLTAPTLGLGGSASSASTNAATDRPGAQQRSSTDKSPTAPGALAASPSASMSAASSGSASQAATSPSTGSSTQQATHVALANYLTAVANAPAIRHRSKAFRRFVRVRTDDLQSVRVERRVRKVRSDLAQHVKLSVAPTNTNVGITPSQSDIGEETRTDDEPEERSLSGRSTGNNNPSGAPTASRPEVPVRSTSVDATREGDTASRAPGFEGIPEEHAPPPDGGGGGHSQDASEDTRGEDASERRERRRRRRVQDRDKVTVDDFEMIRVLGKGCAGKVLLVRHRPTKGLFAMKSIHKRHVLAHQELQHTLTEQAVLKRMAKEANDPFVVRLWWSFHDKNNLYLVMDFHPGGDLATQLSRWGRLGRDRARFYAAEIVEGVEGLHKAGVIYRDLKPENVLIGADGHIVLSDFGLSKEFPRRDVGGTSTPPPGSPSRSLSTKDVTKGHLPHWMSSSEDRSSSASSSQSPTRPRNRWADDRDTTTTFCGTAEYLAPEVIQGAAYSYEVDWWSFGTMLYEMLTGITPFWADTHADMYVRVLHDELVFPEDRVIDQDTKSILRGLLQRNPLLRMKEPRIKRHPYFSMIEWAHVFHKRYIPPYIPPINPLDETDTQNFDETFLDMQPVVYGEEDEAELAADEQRQAQEREAEGASASAAAAAAVKAAREAAAAAAADGKSLFDGYSFRGRRDSEASASILSSSPDETSVVADAPAAVAAADPAAPAAPEKVSTDSAAAAVKAKALRRDAEESEDEEAAARAAVAALDRLEREASGEELFSSRSNLSASTRPTSIEAGTSAESAEAASGNARPTQPAPGSLARDTIAETDDEDEDWDMVDASGALKSEMNGGKGQNLFARGVVDTYRLLRRQESSRIPPSASYNSATIRPFNRIARRRTSAQKPTTREGSSGVTSEASADGASAAPARASAADDAEPEKTAKDDVGKAPPPAAQDQANGAELSRSSSSTAAALASPNTAAAATATQRKGGASPSLASSDDFASQERTNRQRLKKIKRFTTFFEATR